MSGRTMGKFQLKQQNYLFLDENGYENELYANFVGNYEQTDFSHRSV